MRRTATALIAVMSFMVFAGTPATAAKPEFSELHFALEDQICSEGVSYDLELNGREIVHEVGDTTTFKIKLDGEITVSNGTLISVHHNWQETYDYVQRTLTVTGIAYGTWVVGASAKIVDRGRIVFDLDTGEILFQAGHFHDPFDPHELTCELIHSVSG